MSLKYRNVDVVFIEVSTHQIYRPRLSLHLPGSYESFDMFETSHCRCYHIKLSMDHIYKWRVLISSVAWHPRDYSIDTILGDSLRFHVPGIEYQNCTRSQVIIGIVFELDLLSILIVTYHHLFGRIGRDG